MADGRISEAEWEVMNILWNAAPQSSSEVVERLAEVTGWSPSTVKTLLSRLVRKGFLSHEQQGNRYLYRPAVSREASIEKAGASFVERVFGGDAASLLLHFARRTQLAPEEVEELRRLLGEREGD